jgi:hypothetical protein
MKVTLFWAWNLETMSATGMRFFDSLSLVHLFDGEIREHNVERFSKGVPQALWYSQHAGGEAFTYGATEKQGQRPVAYSGKGTHAVYAIPG